MSSPPVTTTIEPSSDIETENTTHAVLFHTHEGVAPEGDREEKPSTVFSVATSVFAASTFSACRVISSRRIAMRRSVAVKYPSKAPPVTTTSMRASMIFRLGFLVVAKK